MGETIYASGYYTETDGKKISKHIYIGSTRVASQVMSRSCETSTTLKKENTLYYHTDHLGSSGYVTDKKGEFYEHTEYTSSGESWVNEKVTGNADLPFKYTSKEQDAETVLYYYGARYYDARTSRWISTDPILEDYLPNLDKILEAAELGEIWEPEDELLGMGGVYNSINLDLYAYVHNNPVNLIDPEGTAPRNDFGNVGEAELVKVVQARGEIVLVEPGQYGGADTITYDPKSDTIKNYDNKASNDITSV